tara:strand:- start:1522 stop:1920 length:399 start_codon:yes stop_codon:yes gene_type:complete
MTDVSKFPPTRGDAAEAVDRFFDRAEAIAPQFVGRMPALIISVCAAIVIFLLGWLIVDDERQRTEGNDDPMKRFRWIVFLFLLLFISMKVQEAVMDKVYMISMYKKNANHFAWTYWLSKYAASSKAPFSVLG